MARKYSPSASKDVEREMHKFKRGNLKRGKGGTVKSRKQAIAIGLSEARKRAKRFRRRRPARVCPASQHQVFRHAPVKGSLYGKGPMAYPMLLRRRALIKAAP